MQLRSIHSLLINHLSSLMHAILVSARGHFTLYTLSYTFNLHMFNATWSASTSLVRLLLDPSPCIVLSRNQTSNDTRDSIRSNIYLNVIVVVIA